MPAQPPKLETWNKSTIDNSPGVYDSKPTVPTTWQYWTAAVGYWLPHSLNLSARNRAGLRMLR